MFNQTGVFNDPHSTPAVKICFVLLDFEKLGWTDVRAKRMNIVNTTGRVWVGLVDQQDMCVINDLLSQTGDKRTDKNSYHYWPCVWVGLVDQQ